MVTIRNKNRTTDRVDIVDTPSRLQKYKNRQAFLARTEGKVWDEDSQQFVENDNYNKSELELAGDSVIAENEYWDNLSDEEYNQVMRDLEMMEDDPDA